VWLALDGTRSNIHIVPILQLFRWPREVDQVMIIAIRMCRLNLPYYSTRIQFYAMPCRGRPCYMVRPISNANLGARISV